MKPSSPKGTLRGVSTSSDKNNSSTKCTIMQYDFLRVSDKVHRYFSDDTSNLFHPYIGYGSLCDHSYCARYADSMRERNMEETPSGDFAKFMTRYNDSD